MSNQKLLLKKIKLSRLSKDWTQENMAKKLNVSIPTYSRFERGVTKTNYAFLQKVCALLEINLESLNYEFKNDSLAVLEEDETTYGENELIKTKGNFSISSKNLNYLIGLLEKQQEINHEILKKIKALKV